MSVRSEEEVVRKRSSNSLVLQQNSAFLTRSQSNLGGTTFETNLWEDFISGMKPQCCPSCGFISASVFVLLIVIAAVPNIKMSDAFGIFVLDDDVTQAYFSHYKATEDMTYFTDSVSTITYTIPVRAVYAGLTYITYEASPDNDDNECPGDDCDLTAGNLITSSMLDKIRTFESSLMNDATYQSTYCGKLAGTSTSRCYPPTSLLQLLFWGDGSSAADRSAQLAALGFGTPPLSCICSVKTSCSNCNTPSCIAKNSSCTDVNECSYESPAYASSCSSSAWAYTDSDSGAAAGSSYTDIFDFLCGNSTAALTLQEAILPNFACGDNGNYIKNNGVMFLRSIIYYGMPVETTTTDLDYVAELEILQDNYADTLIELCDTGVDKAYTDSGEKLVVYVNSQITESLILADLQMADMYLAVLSFLLVFLYMWFTVESFFLASMGMLQVLFSVFPTYLIWLCFPNGSSGFQFLQFLAVFIILGIGADDIFVLVDAWKQASHEQGDLSPELVYILAYRRAFFAMLATTATTAWAFMLGITNKVPCIADFCVFASLIVVFDFLFCIIFFSAAVPIFFKSIQGYCLCCCGPKSERGKCGQPGCCWGLTRLIWSKVTKADPNDQTNQRFLERFFEGPLYNFLNRFKFFFIGFWSIVLIVAIIAIVLGVKIAQESPSFLPADHPIQRGKDLQEEYFTQTMPAQMNVVWGLDAEAVEEWDGVSAVEIVRYNAGNMASATSEDGQQKILNLCQATDADGVRCQDTSCLVKGHPSPCEMVDVSGYSLPSDKLCQTGRYCIMEQVKEYTELNNLTFPVSDLYQTMSSSAFSAYMNNRFDVMTSNGYHWDADNYKSATAGTGVIFDDGQIKYMWMTFNATFTGTFLAVDVGEQIYDDWQSFVNQYAGGTNFFHINIMYLLTTLQTTLVEEAKKSVAVSFVIAFIVLVLVTWNAYISLLGTLNIGVIILVFLGLWPVIGWELDLFNVIFLIMAVGLAVDYTVHLLHAFNESMGEDRLVRTRQALASMGITVLSGAVTTLLAACPLFGCQSVMLQRYGIFIFIVIFLSILLAITLLVPLLLAVGPNKDFGDIWCFFWLSKKCKKSKEKGVSEVEVVSPQVIGESETKPDSHKEA